jgi:Tol biopolymer transport system component
VFLRQSADPERHGLWVLSIDAPEDAVKLVDASVGAFAGDVPGMGPTILFVQAGRLLAQAIDLKRLELTGTARQVLPIGEGGFSASRNGALAYGDVVRQRPARLAWFDRSGIASSYVGDEQVYQSIDLSPDGERVTMARGTGREAGNELWSMDLRRGTALKLTSHRDGLGLWSPDASRVIFSSYREGPSSLWERPSNGTGVDRLVLKQPGDIFPNDWSRDGKFLLYTMLTGSPSHMDVYSVAMSDATKTPTSYQGEPFHQKQAQFSPNGRLVAYASDETGRFEIYVRTFPDPSGGKWPVSSAGGLEPRWTRDGKELLYWSGRKLMSMAVGTTPTFVPGETRELFTAPIQAGYTNDGHRWQVSPDGKRFLVLTHQENQPTPIRVVLNWPALIADGR